MKKPELYLKWYGVLNLSLFTVVFLTTIMGFIPYLKFGDDIEESVTLNFGDDITSKIIKILVALGIFLTYAVQFHVVVDVTWWDLLGRREKVPTNVLCWELLYRVGLCIVTVIIALTVPYLGIILSLIGSVLSTGLALIFPSLCDVCLRLCPEEEGRLKGKNAFTQGFRYSMDAITLVFAVLGLISGLIINTYSLYEAFKDNPFGYY